MALVSLPMPELTCSFVQSLNNRIMNQDTRNRGVAAPETFSDGLNIRDYVLLLPCMKSSTTTHSTHDLIKNEQSAVFLADGFHGGEVTWYSRNTAECL